MRNRSTLIMLLAAGSLLAACQKAPEQPPENQAVAAPEPVAPTPPLPAPEPAPAPPPAPKVTAAPEPSADQQMLDDADATGMTSHTSRDDNKEAPANQQ